MWEFGYCDGGGVVWKGVEFVMLECIDVETWELGKGERV